MQEDSEIFMRVKFSLVFNDLDKIKKIPFQFMAHLMKVPTQKTIISSLDIHHALIANMVSL